MKEKTKSNRCRQIMMIGLLSLAFIFIGSTSTYTQATYKAGDRVECDTTSSGKWWTKGTIVPFEKGDFGGGQEPDGSWYRFKADYNGIQYPCKPEFMRRIAGAQTAQKGNNAEEKTTPAAAEEKTTDERKDAAEEEEFLDCPVAQKKVKNGAAPSLELVKQIIRCRKGEKAVDPGDEGAVKVDISAAQIGAARPWIYGQDIEGKPGDKIYPVKATFTVRTLYRNATEVEENAIRILNFFVNSFGEWQIGSEELVKSAKARRIPKN